MLRTGRQKILMVGPGLGHNILPWLEYLDKEVYYDVTFLCSEFSFKKQDFPNLKIVEHSLRYKNILSIFILFRKQRFNYLYIHGASSGLNTLLLSYFVFYKALIINVWGELILDKAKWGSFKERIIYKMLFRKTRLILFSWYGTKQKFDDYFPAFSKKGKVSLLGLHRDWFKDAELQDGFAKSFLDSIPENQIVCIWPKSILPLNRFDLVVRAIRNIKIANPKLLDNFCLYIWPGNVEDKLFRKEIVDFIKQYDLTRHIKIVEHPFLSFSDMKWVQNRSDFSINFGNTDQLSSTVMEPILLRKPIAVSNISAYQLLNEKFGFQLPLFDNNIESIQRAFEGLLSKTLDCDQRILKLRSEILIEKYQFDKNLDNVFTNILKQI